MTNHHSRSTIEPLETRIAPAVTVTFTGGALTLAGSGTALVAEIIAVDADTFVITEPDGITYGSGPTSTSVFIDGAVKSLTVTGTNGDDTLAMDGLAIAGDANIDLSSGENDLVLTSLAVAGSLSVKTTSGSDLVKFSGSTISVKKNLTLDLGGDQSLVTFDAALTSIGGDFSYASQNVGTPDDIQIVGTFATGGNATFTVKEAAISVTSPVFKIGKNLRIDATASLADATASVLAIGGTESSPTVTLLSVGGDMTYLGGPDTDKVTLLGLGSASVKGVLKFDTGLGDADVQVAFTKFNARQVQFNAAPGSDAVAFGLGINGTVPGGVQVTTGDASDRIKINLGGSIGPLSVDLGDGNNEAEIFANTIIRGAIHFVGGKDDDKMDFILGGSTGPVVCELGDGTNTPTFRLGGKIPSLQITGGEGNDTLSTTLTASTGKLTFDLGDGTNEAMILAGLPVSGTVSFAGGKDNDKVTLNLSGSGPVACDLGDGTNNAMVVTTGKMPSFKLTAGSGSDTVFSTFVGSPGLVSFDLGDGLDIGQINLTNSKASGVSLKHGTGTANFGVSLFSSKISGGITVDAKQDGTTAVLGTDSTVGGLIRLIHGDHTGAAGATVTGFNFTLGGIDASFGNGGQNFVAIGGVGLDVKGAVHHVGGDGIDIVQIVAAANLHIRKGIDLAGREGEGGVSIAGSNLDIASVKATGGAAVDGISIQGSGIIGPITGDFGAGANALLLERTDAPLVVKSINVTSTALAGEADTATLTGVQITGSTSLRLGAGDTAVTIDDTLFGGALDLRTGAGADTVKIDTLLTKIAATITKAAATIDLGDDADTLDLGAGDQTTRLITLATFTAAGGSGTNTLTNPVTNVFAKPPTFTGF